MRSTAENWDFIGAEQLSQEIIKHANPWKWDWSLADIIASTILYMAMPNGISTMKTLYINNSIGKTVVSFAACSAYKKTHKEFPATLSAAMLEVNLPIPIDLATSQKISYRLENNIPVVWFAGIDGVNDGGQKAYLIGEQNKPIAGTDLIFSYGQLPLYEK